MATSVSGSSSINGLRTNPNQIMGLVSGLDTQSMIEGLVESYSNKIVSLQQNCVTYEWEQEAYRDIINGLNDFTSKYASFSNPATNIFSSAFFDSATTTQSTGTNSDAVNVSGTSDTSVYITNVLQTATTARLESSSLTDKAEDIQSDEGVDLAEVIDEGNLYGTMTFTYGTTDIKINVYWSDHIDADTPEGQAQQFADLINEKLAEQTYDGDPATGVVQVQVGADGTSIEVVAGPDAASSNSITLSSLGGNMKSVLGLYDDDGEEINFSQGFNMADANSDDLMQKISAASSISGQSISVNLNGTSKTVQLATIADIYDDSGENIIGYTMNGVDYGLDTDSMNDLNAAIVADLNEKITAAVGSGVTVSNATDSNGMLTLQFDTTGTSTDTLQISGSVLTKLGWETTSDTSYVNTSSTLSSLGIDLDDGELVNIPASGNVTFANGKHTDSDGDEVAADDEGNYYKVDYDDDGNQYFKQGNALVINGVEVGVFTADDKLSDVLSAINTSDAGVTASLSTLTNKVVFTAAETGETSNITIEGAIGEAIFGTSEDWKEVAGQNAIVLAEVNGSMVELERTSNTINIDGLTITVKSTLNATDDDGNAYTLETAEAAHDAGLLDVVGFEEVSDYTAVIEGIEEMINDYNELMSTIKAAFSTVPLTMSSGGYYKPLTDEDAGEMTEAQIASYEEKAKTGLLFGDTNMRSLYNSLNSAFSASGTFGMDLYNMGFEVGYGTVISGTGDMVTLDTEKLLAALENDFETVKNVFINSTDGVMADLKDRMEEYGSVTGSKKGILVDYAGSELSALSLLSNTLQDKIDAVTSQIASWEDKLTNKVEFYTAKFTALEVLMSEMNSQSSALSSFGSSY